MQLTEAPPKRQWGVRRKLVARTLVTPPAFDLAPPPWALRLLEGGNRVVRPREWPLSVALRETERFTLVSVRAIGAAELNDVAFERAAADVYAHLAEVVGARPNRHPVRLWNHIPGIRRRNERGLDRYMVFNAGRFAACSEWFGSPDAFDRLLPTASAVGHDGADLVVHLLAADAPGTAVENPRQVPSYRYSQRFGPRPPCFARATTVRWDDDGSATVLVGGTASIRGEDTTHRGDLPAQARETFDNMAALVRAAGADGLAAFESLRVYYVHEADRTVVERVTRAAFPQVAAIEYVKADLCRPDLLVEIEGVARSQC
jgi:enamine deaminase RidA (YjgF/YER057c/UK114 family)